MQSLSWVALLAVLLAAGGYALHNGLYVGTDVAYIRDDSGWWWKRECRYLFPSGIVVRRVGGWATEVEAANEVCRLFLAD